MNVHICKEDNRKRLFGLISIGIDLDVCVVTETWIKEGRANEVVQDFDEKRYSWFSRERKHQKSHSGDGGVGILVKKNVGEITIVKTSKEYDTMWIEINRQGERLFFAVYMLPEGSSRDNDSKAQLLELEADILVFRKQGKVVILGDFNARIGQQESRIIRDGKYMTFARMSQDQVSGSAIIDRGKQFVQSMNACNMIILNGIDNKGENTFESVNKGQSTVDYIVLGDDFVIPRPTEQLTEGDVEPNFVDSSAKYVQDSTKV